eukprot:g12044.t1
MLKRREIRQRQHLASGAAAALAATPAQLRCCRLTLGACLARGCLAYFAIKNIFAAGSRPPCGRCVPACSDYYEETAPVLGSFLQIAGSQWSGRDSPGRGLVASAAFTCVSATRATLLINLIRAPGPAHGGGVSGVFRTVFSRRNSSALAGDMFRDFGGDMFRDMFRPIPD